MHYGRLIGSMGNFGRINPLLTKDLRCQHYSQDCINYHFVCSCI